MTRGLEDSSVILRPLPFFIFSFPLLLVTHCYNPQTTSKFEYLLAFAPQIFYESGHRGAGRFSSRHIVELSGNLGQT